ncbi:MAG: DUF3999 family protein [Vicinamibacterales bacterium]
MTRRAAALTALVLLCLTLNAQAQARSDSADPIERPIVTAGKGPQKLRIDVPLLIGGQRFVSVAADDGGARVRDGLGDLRLFDRAGREVGYLLIAPPPQRAPWIPGTVLPIAETRKTSGFEVDLGAARTVDALMVEGLPPPFMKRLMLEGSGDRSRWTILAEQGTLFDLPQERVRQTSIGFGPGVYRYLRVTWDDASSGRMPQPRRVSAREGAARPPAGPLRSDISFERQSSEPGRSRYRLRLPASGLPVVAMVLDVGTGDVFRTVVVTESRFSGTRADPVELGRARLAQTARSAGAADILRLPIEPPRGSELQLVVEDGNNPPLGLEKVGVEFAALPVIYFEAPDAGPMTARYGNRAASPPQYDLEAKRTTVDLDALPEASWGDQGPATSRSGAPATPVLLERGARLEVSEFAYQRPLAEGESGLVTLQLDAAVLSHSRGVGGRFSDVRVVDSEGYQIPYLLERRDEPLSIDLSIQNATPEVRDLREPASGNRSFHAIELPHGGLPGSRLVLETSDRVFRRPLQVGIERSPDRQHRDTWFEVLTSTVWQHADQGTPAPPLEMAIAPRDAARLLLVVEDGDNRALPLTAARLLLPSWRLRFFRPSAPVRLVYGREQTSVPQYDLALLAPAVMGAEAREITPAPEPAAASARVRFISLKVFWVGLGLATVVLLALIARLMGRAV